MSYYFAQNKLDRVLARDALLTKNIKESVRRQRISSKSKSKRKRKPKSKGKHRKGKKVKGDKGEITIDNQPTQKVSGYSVVNVISAKRGPYKKQQPLGPPGAGSKKGSFGKSGATRTGLTASGSDNIQFRDPAFGAGDGGTREEVRALRRQVDRIEQRLNGGGVAPAQNNPAGPLGAPAQPANAPPNVAAGGGAPPNAGGLGAQNLAVPPPAPPQRKKKGQPPSIPKKQPPLARTASSSSIRSIRTTASEKELARDLGVPVAAIRNISDAEFINLFDVAQQRGLLGGPVRTGGGGGGSSRLSGRADFVSLGSDPDRQLLDLERLLGNPQQQSAAEQAAAAAGRRFNQPHNQRARFTTPRPSQRGESTFGQDVVARATTPTRLNLNPSAFTPEELRRMRGGDLAPEEAESKRSLRLSVRSSQASREREVEEGLPTGRRSPQTTTKAGRAGRTEASIEKFLERQSKINPVSPSGVSPPAAPISTVRSEAVSVPSTPLAIGEQTLEFNKPLGPPAAEPSPEPKPVPRVSPRAPTGTAVARGKVISRYGDYKPPETPRDVTGRQVGSGRGRGGSIRYIGKDQEYQRTETAKAQLSTQLRRAQLLPDTAFRQKGGKVDTQRGGEVVMDKTLLNTSSASAETIASKPKNFIRNDVLKFWDEKGLTPQQRLFTIDTMLKFQKTLLEQDKAKKSLRTKATGFATKAAQKASGGKPLATIYEPPASPAELQQSGVLVSAVPATDPNVNPEGSMIGNVGAAVGAAASSLASGTAGIAGGVLSGIAGGVAAQLPTSSQVGAALGQGAVIGAGALIRGGASAVSAGYTLARDPAVTGQPEAEQ